MAPASCHGMHVCCFQSEREPRQEMHYYGLFNNLSRSTALPAYCQNFFLSKLCVPSLIYARVLQRFLTQFVANRRYNASDIKRFERELLQALKWNLHPVTAHALTMVMLELHPDKSERDKMMNVANALLDMQLPNKDFLKWSTKAVALGCCNAACSITGFTEQYTKIASQISHVMDRETVVCKPPCIVVYL